MATNPVTGNAQSDLALPSAYNTYMSASGYTAADVLAKATAAMGAAPVPKEITVNPGTPWSSITIMLRDHLRRQVELSTGGRQTVLYDVLGGESIMNVIPKFMNADIHADLGSGVFPAFSVNGVEKPEIFAPAYDACLVNGLACSQPGKDPNTTLNHDEARAACVNKGSNWHMMTNWEWAALAYWMLKNGFQPNGNTNWGKSDAAPWETAPRGDNGQPGVASGTGRTLTGLGPKTWRHDGTFQGVADLVGNIWRRVDGFKLVDGQVFMPDDNYYSLAEASWPAQGVYFDSTGTTGTDTVADTNGNAVLSSSRAVPSDDCGNGLGANAPDYDYNYHVGEGGWRGMGELSAYDSIALATRQRMLQALIAPKISSAGAPPFSTVHGMLYARNYGERLPFRGASWFFGAGAGLAALNLLGRRSYVDTYLGFRPAFVP